jgi:hypothetical protein
LILGYPPLPQGRVYGRSTQVHNEQTCTHGPNPAHDLLAAPDVATIRIKFTLEAILKLKCAVQFGGDCFMDTKESNSAKAWTWKGSRLQGLFILILGLVAGYFSIMRPLQQAYSNAPDIGLSYKWAFLSPVLVLLGILAIIVPSMTTDQSFILRGPNKFSFAGWILMIAMLIVGFGTYYLLDQQIDSLGYK